MKVGANTLLCEGHAVCERAAPQVFQVSDHGKVLLITSEPAESLRDAVEEAIRLCPVNAIYFES